MKNAPPLHTIVALLLALVATSCQKVIDIDLNEADPVLVIEGLISDQPGPYTVTLTKTRNFDEPNDFPGVSGASVILSDNAGNSETLVEISPGVYRTTTLAGIPTTSYSLQVQDNDRSYHAESHMPAPVEIDTVVTDSLTFGAQSNKYLRVRFQDPAGVRNYYRIVEIINGDTLRTINLAYDEFTDGQAMTADIFSDMDPELLTGDTATLLLQCIDEKVFTYYTQLIQVMNGASQSAAPANPMSNIEGDALGYFKAYSVTSSTIVVP